MVAIGSKLKVNRKKSVFIVNEAASQQRKNSYAEIDFSNRDLLINPGSKYLIEPDDICIYMSIKKEENYDFKAFPGIINFIELLHLNT